MPLSPESKEARKLNRSYSNAVVDPGIRLHVEKIRSLPCVDKESGGTLFSCAGFGHHADPKATGGIRKGWNDDYTQVIDLEHGPENGKFWGYVMVVYDPMFPWENVNSALGKWERTSPLGREDLDYWTNKLGKPCKTYDLYGDSPEKLKAEWDDFMRTMSLSCASVHESAHLNRWLILAGLVG